MHLFDYHFLISKIPADLIGITNIISDLRARDSIRRSENAEMMKKLQQTAIIESVRGSNAIEGIVTTRKRLNSLMQNHSEPVNHAEKEILGYKTALSEIYDKDFDANISESLVKHFHHLMLSSTSFEAGKYKTENNWIQERDEEGRIRVRFVPVSAKETSAAMDQWVKAWNDARQDSDTNRLLLIPCAVLDFLCIHPFTDGNGRISRLITIVMLQQAGFDISRYISMEAKINEYKYGYYESLKNSSNGWHENQSNYIPFITYFLQILYACYREMDEKFMEYSIHAIPKNQQVENLLLNSFVPVSKTDILSRLPDISVTTVERVLSDMLKEGKIVKIGTYRNARYKVR